VRRVLHIIREEDLSLTTAAISGLNLSAASDGDDDDDDGERDEHTVLSAAAVAAAARNALRPPSLQTLLEDMPESVAIPHTYSSGGDSEGKSKCKSLMVVQSFYITASYHMADYHMLRSWIDFDLVERVFIAETWLIVVAWHVGCMCVRGVSWHVKIFSITAADKSSRTRRLKHDVIEAVNELIQDINTCHEQIAEQAVEHIHQK